MGEGRCACAVRRSQHTYLYDQWGIRIAACDVTEPHRWHGWVGGNEDLRCPGVPDRSGAPMSLAQRAARSWPLTKAFSGVSG